MSRIAEEMVVTPEVVDPARLRSAIRRVRDNVPVLLMSGYDEAEATRRFTHKGIAGFIEKPFTRVDLAEKLVKVRGSN